MDRLFIHEVGPRDGLQAEKTIVPLEEHLRWMRILLSPVSTSCSSARL